MDYNVELQSNNTDLQAILNTINALPDSCTEEHASELAQELSTQDDLISQIMAVLASKGYKT